MHREYITHRRVPTIQEYEKICIEVGWKDYINFEVAEQSLDQSLFGVVVEFRDDVVGMGRVVGDGAIYFYIQDIAVVPMHRSRGIGDLIMTAITQYLQEHAPEKAFVGLFSSQGKELFYNRHGFNKHEGMTGMFGVIHGGEIK